MKKIEDITVKISEIKNNPNNPRLIKDEAFHSLVESIKEFPEMLEIRPIVVNMDMIILGGNMRFKAAKEAGLKKVPVKRVDLSETKQREFVIKDNVSGGEWDWEILKVDFDLGELQAWGLEIPDQLELFPKEMEPGGEDEMYEQPKKIETDIVPGDVFEIGPHRIMCGDALNPDDVAKLMNGQLADLAHNDPPYGMKKEADGVANDNLNFDKLLQFNQEWIPLQISILKENGSWYCWGIDEPLMDIYCHILKPYFKEKTAYFRNLITWDKGHGQSQNNDQTRSFATADEKCLFFMMGKEDYDITKDNFFEGFEVIRQYLIKERKKCKMTVDQVCEITGKSSASHYFSKSQWHFPTKEHYESIQAAAEGKAFDRSYEDVQKEYEAAKVDYDKLKQAYYETRSYFDNVHDNMNNVWHFERHKKDGTEGDHATPKPIPLCERVVKSSCPEGGLVVDFFNGSGSTMVAAERTNRVAYGMELTPMYVQVTVDRMMTNFPELIVKRNGKKYVKKK